MCLQIIGWTGHSYSHSSTYFNDFRIFELVSTEQAMHFNSYGAMALVKLHFLF
jgi:hypothetical protein